MSLTQFEHIRITNITLDVKEQFGSTVDNAAFQWARGTINQDIVAGLSPGRKHLERFIPFIELSAKEQPTVSIQYRSQNGMQTLLVDLDLYEVMAEAKENDFAERAYTKLSSNIEMTLCFFPPRGTVPTLKFPSFDNDILRVCPHFRVLVIGNSGAGKSTLIRTVFGVQEVDISDSRRGNAVIGREFPAANDLPFVLHDSLGFEAGDSGNLKLVKDFVSDRIKRKDLKEKLHAVWVCLAVPYAKGRFTEYGTETFIKDREKIMGKVPLIVALTQRDLLDKLLIMNSRREGADFKTVEDAQPYIAGRRNDFLNEICRKPLLKITGGVEIPHVAVSAENYFEGGPTLSKLLEVTTSEIAKFMRADPEYAAAISGRR